MVRKSLLVAILTVSISMWGQGRSSTGANAGSAPSGPPPGVPTTQSAVGGVSGQAATGQVTLPSANTSGTPTVPETMGGPAGTGTGTNAGNPESQTTLPPGTTTNGFVGGGTFGGPVLATPGATFAAPAPTAGISSNGIAGVSANTFGSTGVQSTAGPSTMVFTSGVPLNPPAINATALGATGRIINDMGPSFFGNSLATANTMSLGEVAAAMKSRAGTQNVRVYTNDDAHRIADHLTVNGTNANLPPTGMNTGEQPQNANPSVASAQAPAPVAAGQSATSNAIPATGKPSPGTMIAQNQPPANPTAANASAATEQSQPQSNSATTPQINQKQSAGNEAQNKTLPASATILPLLALVGLLSGGFGFMLRKLKG